MSEQKTPKIIEALEIKNSSNISRVAYTDTNDLVVRFKNGGEYLYKEVPKEAFYLMAKSESAGKYLAAHIKNEYKFEKLDEKKIAEMNTVKVLETLLKSDQIDESIKEGENEVQSIN